MFFKQEKSEMDDFERKRNFVLKEAIMDNIAKMSHNIFAYSFVSEHSKYFFDFEKKNLHFYRREGGRPPTLNSCVC